MLSDRNVEGALGLLETGINLKSLNSDLLDDVVLLLAELVNDIFHKIRESLTRDVLREILETRLVERGLYPSLERLKALLDHENAPSVLNWHWITLPIYLWRRK